MNKQVHFIAIGGAVMHNLAIDMHQMGYLITGSDDEIYEPSLSRLKDLELLPETLGWNANNIHKNLDFIVLGMHAKSDNIEIKKAKELKIPVYSYPELVYKLSSSKKRVVVAGSHGKTTITSMILYVLREHAMDFDYLVGAHIEGFSKMVKISNAPVIIMEGDEYLSSTLDPKPKILHYKPHISVLSGIAWDHINVFPNYESYLKVFSDYLETIMDNGQLIYNQNDPTIIPLLKRLSPNVNLTPYRELERNNNSDSVLYGRASYPISVIGKHNLANLAAAMEVCSHLGISNENFLKSIRNFKGAAKRLQKISENQNRVVFLDFAHAPSKVLATTAAFKDWYPDKKMLAVLELHTFSSLNAEFIPQYKHTLAKADEVIVYFSAHTLKMKNRPDLDNEFISTSFDHACLQVISDQNTLVQLLNSPRFLNYNVLLMTSGNFDRLDLNIFNTDKNE